MQQWTTNVSKSLPEHGIQIALLRRRAAMMGVLPNTSVPEQWFLAVLMDRATNHWSRTPPLDGGEDEDADTGTDTTVTDDDNDDIASFTSQQTPAIDTPKSAARHSSTSRRTGYSPRTFLLKRLSFDVVILTPTERVEICRLRCAVPQRGRTPYQQGGAVILFFPSPGRGLLLPSPPSSACGLGEEEGEGGGPAPSPSPPLSQT